MSKSYIIKWVDGEREEIKGKNILSALRECGVTPNEMKNRGLVSYIEKKTGREHFIGEGI